MDDGLVLARSEQMWFVYWLIPVPGNLGRAGYGATTDGMWPYTYDECDWGTLPNVRSSPPKRKMHVACADLTARFLQQTYEDQPTAAFSGNDKYHEGKLSFLSGQRLSRCTCPGDPNHPGPQRSDNSFYGRAAPELDIFEATISPDNIGQVSQSCQ